MSYSNLKPLTRDQERYQDVYYNAFCKISQKDLSLERVNQFFDSTVMKRLTDVFDRNEEFSLLGVGVGEGPHESHFLKTLQSYFASICNVAVEPNEGMLETFRSKVGALDSDDKSSDITFKGFTGQLLQFMSESPLAGDKYNLISSIHSIYYTGDFETTLTQLVSSMMKDKGIMIILCKNRSLLTETFQKLPWLSESTTADERLTSKDVRDFARRKGYKVTSVDITSNWDITEVFDHQSDFGTKVMDFLTQVAYFRRTAPAELVDDLLTLWRSKSIEDEHGRIQAMAEEEILLISK